MSFKLLTITYLYPEFLKSYYQNNSSIKDKTYNEQYTHLINNTSEPVGAYTNEFLNLKLDSHSIITNAPYLQSRWALENNIKTKSDKELIYQQIKKLEPEVIWLDNIDLLDKSWLNYIKKTIKPLKLIFASHCSPFNDKILGNLKQLSFILTCTPGINNTFLENGLKSYLAYHAFNPQILEKLNQNTTFQDDFIFSGSLYLGGGFHSKRTEFIESLLKQNIEIVVYGNLESQAKILLKKSMYHTIKLLKLVKKENLINKIPVLKNYKAFGESPINNYSDKLKKNVKSPKFGFDMYDLLKASKIVLNMHGTVAGNYAGNVRLFEATGVGSCLLTDSKSNLSELFEIDKEIVTYDNSEECIEKVNWLLNNEDKRNEIATAGQKKTLKYHTVKNRCMQIKEIIESELSGNNILGNTI